MAAERPTCFAGTGVASRRMASSHGRLRLLRSTDPGWTASSIPHVSDGANGRRGFRTAASAGVDWRNLAFAPAILAFVEDRELLWFWRGCPEVPEMVRVFGWIIGVGAPLLLAFVLRRKAAWVNALSAVWVLIIGTFHSVDSATAGPLRIYGWSTLGPYFWAGLGALGLISWGLLERRRERINLGVAGFALTIVIFYFSDVTDKLGRAVSLIGLGVLFLFGGWALERARRKLVALVSGGLQ